MLSVHQHQKLTKIMTFNKVDFAAILKLAFAMAAADNVIEKNEQAVIALEMMRFGVPESDIEPLIEVANAMQPTDALTAVSNMGYEQKKYVAAFLGFLMTVDGKIDDAELKLWTLISTLCNLPTMTVEQAANYMTEL